MVQTSRFRDLKVFATNRPEDKKMFDEIRGLSQAVIQNGGSLHDVIELYSTNSIRQMKKVFKTLKDRQEQIAGSTDAATAATNGATAANCSSSNGTSTTSE